VGDKHMGVKIALGLPTNRGVKAKTVHSLMELVAHLQHEYEIIVSTKGYNLAENRTYIAVQATNKGCTHLLLVDDDMIYEPDTVDKLLAHDKDIVGGLYKTKYENPDWLIEGEIKDSLFECNALGGGLLLIKTEVFRKIPPLWFGYTWHDNGMVKMSNDWYFCERARESGFSVWCDPSVKARHIGLREY
jgi:GT2 family glycosyltransferase